MKTIAAATAATTKAIGSTMNNRKIIAAMALCSALGVTAPGAEAAPRFVSGPYKHTAMYQQPSHVITVAPNDTPIPAVAGGKRQFGPGAMTWAFATGECGEERWGDETGQQIADANVAAFALANVDYIVSTGGQGGVFTCATDAGMERFVKRYQSKNLVGIDFDIEAAQTAQQIDALILHAANIQKSIPSLRFSFTVATHATSDGSGKSLNPTGEAILAAVRKSTLRDYTFNLMVMDYGPPAVENCALKGALCDMGLSALTAVQNVNKKYGIPFAQIEVTAMIGVNDMPGNDFTLEDAQRLVNDARKLKLAGIHFWSLDRDKPCTEQTPGASSTCSSLDVKSGEFNRVLSR
jgi:chitinase